MCKFDLRAFHHFEHDNSIEELKNENKKILKHIKKLDDTIKDLDEKMIASTSFIEKLQQVEHKLKNFQSFEQTIYKKIA